MVKRKLAVVAGALVLVGGAAAIAAVGHREGRMHRDRTPGMEEFAQGPGMGLGMGDERDRGHHRGGRFGRGDTGGEDMRRGWFNRSLTADEFDARTRERFARLDKNSDGVIDAAEVEAEITRATEGRGPIRERMMQRFSGRFDADRDGKITRQETLDRAKRDFARMDLDSDGRITDADLPPMMRGRDVLKGGATGMGGRGGFGFARIIGADANKDGIITQDEYLAEAGRRFDQSDRNKDSAIDKTDRDAMTKEMTDYRVRRFLHAHGAGKDNRVTREQFMASAKQRFAERDANNDGRLDREDGRRGMRMHRGPGEGGPGEGGPGRGGRGSDDRAPPR